MLPFLTLQSVSVATTRSSRKRSRELAWCDVLEGTGLVVPSREFNTPYHFMEMDQEQQATFLARMGLDERGSALLRTKLNEALQSKGVPSPSTMKWSDVPAILHGGLPRDFLLQNPPDVSSSSSSVFDDDVIKSIIEIMASKFRRLSEMEVVVRVFLMVMIAASDCSDIWVELQPSVKGHSAFTDLLIYIKCGEERRFIEVKRTAIHADLSTQTDETAQVLREAQILLCTEKVKSPMQFLLTNGASWSFGSAAKYSDTKIKLTDVWNASCSMSTLESWKMMIMHLRAFLSGTWPLTAAQPEN